MNAFAPILHDQFGIGQARLAPIRTAAALSLMAAAAPDIIDTRDIDPLWRQMRVRQFKAARAEFSTARRIQIMHERLG